jgi:hypothetical protein
MPETQCQFLEIHLLSLNLIKIVITTLFNTQKNPLISGYISKQNLELLKGTVPFQSIKREMENHCFTDNTNFRSFWLGTEKLLWNAIFFSNLM